MDRGLSGFQKITSPLIFFLDFTRLLDEWEVGQWNWMGTFEVDRLIYKVILLQTHSLPNVRLPLSFQLHFILEKLKNKRELTPFASQIASSRHSVSWRKVRKNCGAKEGKRG